MQSDEKALADELEQEFEDARLNAKLDRVYARTMANETEVLVNLFNKMAKKNKSSKIRDYAESTVKNLVPIQKAFADFIDDGN